MEASNARVKEKNLKQFGSMETNEDMVWEFFILYFKKFLVCVMQGGDLHLHGFHHFLFHLGVDWGSNYWEKLYALVASLRIAVEKGIKSIQVFGDSKITIDWMIGNLKF
jgi:hypothetical protein